MLPLRATIILLLVFVSKGVLGQSFIRDWDRFTCRNWSVELLTDTSKYFVTKSPVGRIKFKLRTDPAYQVELIVFDKKVAMRSDFVKQMQHWIMMQSCAGTVEDGKQQIPSFLYGQFFYFVTFCNKCFTGSVNQDCNELARCIKANFRKAGK